MNYRFLLLLILLLPISHIQAKTYSFAVVPQQSAKKSAKLWTPILSKISKDTGVKLQFTTAKNIPTFEKRLAAGKYDFAYMNPYHYTVFSKKPGYVALAKRKKQKIKGIVVVHKDSPIQTLSGLQDSKLAFPSPAAFAASILPRAKLKQDGINFTPSYVSSHDSVYLNVSKNIFVAGGGVMRTFNNTNPEVKKQLRVLWKTNAYTPHAFAAHPKIPSDINKKITDAFAQLNKNEKGKALLRSIKIKHGIEAANNSDWDDVRALNIEALDN